MIKDFLTPNIILSLVIIIAATIGYAISGKIISRLNNSDLARGSASAGRIILSTSRILKFVFFLFIILLLFEVNGINVTSLIASFGVVGAVVALAAQDLMKDLINGIYISGEKMFNPGDVITYNGDDGVVIDFNLRSTKIKLLKNDNFMYISNRNISDVQVVSSTNYLDIPLPYEFMQDEVDLFMDEAVSEIQKLDDVESISYLGPQEFESSAIMHRLMIITSDPLLKGKIRRDIRRLILNMLEDRNISIPYEKVEILN